MTKRKHDYPHRITNLMTTLQEALYDNYDDGVVRTEGYYDFLPEAISVTSQKFIGDSRLLNGFCVYDGADLRWRVVWSPLYAENFLIQLVTGVETRDVWQWTKLRKVPTEFHTFETIRRYDAYSDWDEIETVLIEALDSYHEWKAGRLHRGGAVAEVSRAS